MTLPYTLAAPTGPNVGMIVLQADETIEGEMRRLLPGVPIYTSRVPSGDAVTPSSLNAMKAHLGTAASLLPRGMAFDTVAYACTSGAAHIGPDKIHTEITKTTTTATTTDPVRALLAACTDLNIRTLGLITPYSASVSDHLRTTLQANAIQIPAFGTFDQSTEATVVRIDTASLIAAGRQVAAQAPIDALFLSCTNLRTLAAIPILERDLGLPVLSSNTALAWHITQQAQTGPSAFASRLTAPRYSPNPGSHLS